MHTRGGADITAAFPEVADALRNAAGDASVVLDGELVALSDEGIPQRYAVVERWLAGAEARRRTPVNYEVFDILHLDGEPLLNHPLYERKARLHDALRPNATVHVCHFEEGEGVAMYAAARELGLHGIVAKDKHSLYEPGKRSRHWLSTKHARTMNLVVGGYTFGGSRQPFDSLLLGVFEDGLLRFTGAAGGGTARGDQRLLHRMLSQRHTDQCPFAREPRRQPLLPLVRAVPRGRGRIRRALAGRHAPLPRLQLAAPGHQPARLRRALARVLARAPRTAA